MNCGIKNIIECIKKYAIFIKIDEIFTTTQTQTSTLVHVHIYIKRRGARLSFYDEAEI